MNKHLVAFLSVFSLGLVLSVYYVVIPKNPAKEVVMRPSSEESSAGQATYFATLRRYREEEHLEIIDAHQAVMVSTTASAEQKKSALNAIEVENGLYALELKIDGDVVSLGYPQAYTRIDDLTVQLVVGTSKEIAVDTIGIMYMVLTTLENASYRIALTVRSCS